MVLYRNILRLGMNSGHQINFCRQKHQVENNKKHVIGCPRHLICFKDWTKKMVLDIVYSAIQLKRLYPDPRGLNLELLKDYKILTLKETNHPVYELAISKACTMLGASNIVVNSAVEWDFNFMGRVYSQLADLIFVSTTTHGCIRRFSETSEVPVLCMISRTHGSMQAMSTIMAIIEELGPMDEVTIGWLGPNHPVLNSYLLLAPMLGSNMRFLCHCDKSPVSPLLEQMGKEMVETAETEIVHCKNREDVFCNANVIIAGPTTTKKDKLKYFTMKLSDIEVDRFLFFHSMPRGKEVDDKLFFHENSRTFSVFYNMQYIAAAVMANLLLNHLFKGYHP